MADDEVFAKYILDLEARWEDGTTDVNIDELMNIADNKYKTMVLKKVWKAPTKEGEKLIALTAAYETLVKQNKGQEDTSGQPNASKGAAAERASGVETDCSHWNTANDENVQRQGVRLLPQPSQDKMGHRRGS
jgi:hypothetical protein